MSGLRPKSKNFAMSMVKSVNDTNVWVAGIHWQRGAGRKILLHWQEGRFQHFISADILFEIIRVLRQVFGYSDERLYDWYWVLLAGSTFVAPRQVLNIIAEDPDDNKFITCALEGDVDYIVSEDKDLQRLGQYQTIRVADKQAFLRILESG